METASADGSIPLLRDGEYDAGAHHGGPVVVAANWYRFRSGQHIRHSHVESVSFVWVVQGSGTIVSGGESFALTSNTILRLPWKHEVDYRPDPLSPFQVGTIHLIPEHDASVPVDFRVGVGTSDPLIDAAWRRGPAQPGPAVALSSRAVSGRNVITLASYCIERFLAERVSEPAMRSLASLIFEESAEWGEGGATAKAVPTVLELMIDHILANLDRHLTVAEVARVGQCSSTTAERLFARYTGLSVLSWSRRRRMQEAALLLRTSGLRVNEVARLVGYADPLYFSRVFTAVHAVPPSRYAKEQLRP
ncbi:helix-turn-helix transcriptional regulator [Glaciibacter superstes]|uniref:helix-turn-helix transcriptional regulator n=1 Tax=Glaciibacter superstes TaxID=501023 RepID=UPI0003B4843C|nr:AraC family transcriptional regulator [Glaciibacter superstes]